MTGDSSKPISVVTGDSNPGDTSAFCDTENALRASDEQPEAVTANDDAAESIDHRR